MKQIIIGIHGLGNKPPKSVLQDWWLKSIREGLDRIDKERLSVPFELVYWADIIHPSPLNLKVKNKQDPLYINEIYKKGSSDRRAKKSSIKIRILKYIEDQIDKVFLNDDLSINFKNVTEKFIHHYFKDLETYYSENCDSLTDPDCNAKDEIKNRLIETLNKYKGYQIMLIAHSMGSIVAYDVLSSDRFTGKINSFITIGSPLGLPVIISKISSEQKKNDPEFKMPRVPECILERWVNMSDVEDKVALDHTLHDDFTANSRGLLAEDFIVNNDYEIHGEPNPHKSYGYLRTPEISEIIHQFILTKRVDLFYQQYKFFAKKISSGFKSIKKLFKKEGK